MIENCPSCGKKVFKVSDRMLTCKCGWFSIKVECYPKIHLNKNDKFKLEE
jgi:hypothetical protein